MSPAQSRAEIVLDPSTPVLVLKMHHGSLGIARSLGRLGVPVYALAAKPHEAAARSRYWKACYPWNMETATPQQSLDRILEIGARLGRRTVLIAASDRDTEFVADHADALGSRFVFPALQPETVRTLTSKIAMHGLASKLGIPTPETSLPKCRADVVSFLDRATFPVMLKADDGARLFARAGRKMAIVRDEAELLELYERWEEPENPNLMLQEYIPGGQDTVWMFNGYFDAGSECLLGFTGKKIRQNPVAMGSTSLGICVRNAEVDELTRRFMKAIGYRGILDIGYRYDARDRRYKVLDVNPRIGSTFRLFVDDNGLDVVRALYRDLTGQPVPAAASYEGRKWCAEDQDLESFLGSWRAGDITLAQWLASFRGVRESAWFARDDLRPFGALLRGTLSIAARSRYQKLALQLPFLRPRARTRDTP